MISHSYIGGLSNKITDQLLYEIFSTIGHVESCKLIKDKNVCKPANIIHSFIHSSFIHPIELSLTKSPLS